MIGLVCISDVCATSCTSQSKPVEACDMQTLQFEMDDPHQGAGYHWRLNATATRTCNIWLSSKRWCLQSYKCSKVNWHRWWTASIAGSARQCRLQATADKIHRLKRNECTPAILWLAPEARPEVASICSACPARGVDPHPEALTHRASKAGAPPPEGVDVVCLPAIRTSQAS